MMATIHGRYYEPEYQAWKNMLRRVFDPRWEKHYGHVKVFGDWAASYDSFLSHVGRRPSPAHSLDRIDPFGNYSPGNVRWSDRSTQSRNTRNHCTNKTGIRGVSWSKSKGKWRVTINVKNKQVHLGYFTSIVDATVAREDAEKKFWKQ